MNINNVVIDADNKPIGCVGLRGEAFNNKGAYIGRILGERYAYRFDGEYVNVVDDKAKVRVYGKPFNTVTANDL